MRKILVALLLAFTACQVATPSHAPSFTPEASLLVSTNTPASEGAATPTRLDTAGPTATQAAQPAETAAPSTGSASAFPDPAGYAWVKVLDGLNKPLFLTHAGDGSGRKFILSQAGTIQVWKGGQLLPQPFLDISDQISPEALGNGYTERGLLGLAFDPHYATSGYFYVNYTDLDGNTVIARFKVSGNPDQADPQSEVQLIHVQQPYPNHNGGMLAFGPDGYLYIGLGDGGSAGDPQGRAQSLDTLLGKILRIDVDKGMPYSIPPGNPFEKGGGKPEIWAYGLRNPWRFSFDTATGDLYIGDVGQNLWEEIDFQAAGSPGGQDYGWNYLEATHPYQGAPPAGLKLVGPVAEYSHADGCSVSGGIVYRGAKLPEWKGIYFYGDYCSGQVWGLRRDSAGAWQSQVLFQTGLSISSFGSDEAGEIYLAALGQGEFYQLQAK